MTSAAREFLLEMLRARSPAAADWIASAARDVHALGAADHARFAKTISLASRHAPRGPLAPTRVERTQVYELCEGLEPERWSALDAARIVLVLSRADLAADAGVAAIEECFRYADMGELVALYRSLALLPAPERFVWRAGEGCRSSMRAVYEAAACDTPFGFRHFDDASWRQLVIKALFVEAPLWRVHGLDRRLDEELARIALDLAEERRAAGRNVQPELWLCLGRFGGDRARTSIEREIAGTFTPGRRGAAVALARAGGMDALSKLCASERDPAVRATMEDALKGRIQQQVYAGIVT